MAKDVDAMLITPEQISEVIADIYRAVGDPQSFTPVVRRIKTLLNGSSAMLFTPTCSPREGGFGFVDHFDAELFNRYCAEYRDLDPWAREAHRKNLLRTGVTATDEMLISQQEMQKEPFFHEVQLPMDVVRVCCSVVTADDDTRLPFTYLSVFRGVRSCPFSDEERRAVRLLIPHVLQALRLACLMERSDAELWSAYSALHSLDYGVVLLNKRRKIVFMNREAERQCTLENGLAATHCQEGRCMLHASIGRENIALQQAIDVALHIGELRTASEVPKMHPSPVAIHNLKSDATLLVTVLPLTEEMPRLGTFGARVMVLVESLSDRKPIGERMFATLFRFTAAESRVAQALLSGEQPKAIAGRLGISVNTIRTHIKSLYTKTGTRRMASLINLLSRVAETRASAESMIDSVWR